MSLLPHGPINGKIDRRAWECALLFKIKEDLKHNNLVLENGKRFSSFNRFFMPEVTWKNHITEFFRNNKLPENAKDAEVYLTNYLGEAYDIYFMGEIGIFSPSIYLKLIILDR